MARIDQQFSECKSIFYMKTETWDTFSNFTTLAVNATH